MRSTRARGLGSGGGARRAAGTFPAVLAFCRHDPLQRGRAMNGIIYLIGLVVVIMAVLSFFGFR
jgi:hypothetical protein